MAQCLALSLFGTTHTSTLSLSLTSFVSSSSPGSTRAARNAAAAAAASPARGSAEGALAAGLVVADDNRVEGAIEGEGLERVNGGRPGRSMLDMASWQRAREGSPPFSRERSKEKDEEGGEKLPRARKRMTRNRVWQGLLNRFLFSLSTWVFQQLLRFPLFASFPSLLLLLFVQSPSRQARARLGRKNSLQREWKRGKKGVTTAAAASGLPRRRSLPRRRRCLPLPPAPLRPSSSRRTPSRS